MRKHSTPKIIKYSSLKWLINFLNLRIESEKASDRKKVKTFLDESWPQDTSEMALKAQQKIVHLMDMAIKANSPQGLVMSLNSYVEANSESWDPRRSHPPVRAYWFVRPLQDVSALNAGQSVLTMGPRKWVIQPTTLMHDTEGRVWQSISQCMVNGELGRIRRCVLPSCKTFFEADDARRKFCCANHQRQFDANASKARVKVSREAKKATAQGLKPPEKKKELPTTIVTEAQQFASFIRMARGNVVPGDELAQFIKRKIPGEWKTVFLWLKCKRSPDDIWTSLDERTKNIFRVELWQGSRATL